MKNIDKIEIKIQVSNDKEEKLDSFSQNLLRCNENYRTIFELKQKFLWEDKENEF